MFHMKQFCVLKVINNCMGNSKNCPYSMFHVKQNMFYSSILDLLQHTLSNQRVDVGNVYSCMQSKIQRIADQTPACTDKTVHVTWRDKHTAKLVAPKKTRVDHGWHTDGEHRSAEGMTA